MAYGSVLADVVQGSTSGTPPQFNDGNGTQVGTLCRAWVNYKGTATRGINASFNVSSVTFNSTGNYTINFATALADANYSAVVGVQNVTTNNTALCFNSAPTSSSLTVLAASSANAGVDPVTVCVSVFR